jgi:hypothetical protein
MAFGKKVRRRKRKGKGLVGAQKRREKAAKLLEVQQIQLEKFKLNYPHFAEDFEEIRANAAEGYQIPKTDYEVADHLLEGYELVLRMGRERKAVLKDLNAIYSRKSDSNPYLSLLKALSVPGYNEKILSKLAQSILKAFEGSIPPDDFNDHRLGKRKPGLGRKK